MNPAPAARRRSATAFLGLAVKGFCMGAADVVPGVSGGTMALILGIYEDLLLAIRSFDATFIRRLFVFRIREAVSGVQWDFLAALGAGILCAVFSLARGLSWLLHHQPVFIWSFFFGLIAASVFMVSRRITQWRPGTCAGLVFGAAGAYVLVGLTPMSTPEAPWFLFLSGAVAICAMILPGISGAFILVLMGKYLYVLDAVNNRDMVTLALVAAGALTGLAGFARFLGWLLRRHHDVTIAVLTGLMLGSLRKVWPWKDAAGDAAAGSAGLSTVSPANVLPSHWTPDVGWALALAVAGFLVVLGISMKAEKRP